MNSPDTIMPPNLFRGDSDPTGNRKLKSTIIDQQFQTNLINGGVGRVIFEAPLQHLVNEHISIGWEKTHFLSFSEDYHTAFKYGANNLILSIHDRDIQYAEYFNSGTNWDFAILELEPNKIRWNVIRPGLYEGFYSPTLIEFSRLNIEYRILLLNVEEILLSANNANYKQSVEKAKIDKEWLLLPATIKQFNFNQWEYSAILDGSCIKSKKFKSDLS